MACRSLPRKVTYFEPVPPRLARNAIIESTLPFAADWLDDGSGVELTAVDPHRALVAAAVDERAGVGIRFRPAAAILRQYGEQFRRSPRKQGCRSPKPPRLLRSDL
jgi:hypothetical protein